MANLADDIVQKIYNEAHKQGGLDAISCMVIAFEAYHKLGDAINEVTYWDGHKQGALDILTALKNSLVLGKNFDREAVMAFLDTAVDVVKRTP